MSIDTATMNKVQEDSLAMMIYFDEFCKAHGLQYALAFGTELGAVRHGGFIPWDDDVDFDMPIEEFMKFQKAWEEDGDKELYFLQTKESEPYLSCLFPRIRKNGTTSISPGCRHIPIHWGLPIDIFPVINLPDNTILKWLLILLYKASNFICKYNWDHPKTRAPRITQQLSVALFKGVCKISKLSANSKNVYYPNGNAENRKIASKQVFFPVKPIVFESHSFFGHADPDAYLTWQFDDYMTPPPVEARGGHAYDILDLSTDYSVYTGHKVH